MLLSLLVVLGTRATLGEEAFMEWGWRIPFLISVLLLAISVWIRLRLHESRSEEHTSELQSLMRTSYAVLCLKTKQHKATTTTSSTHLKPNIIQDDTIST